MQAPPGFAGSGGAADLPQPAKPAFDVPSGGGEDFLVTVALEFRREFGVDAAFVAYYSGEVRVKSTRLTAAAIGDPDVDLYPFVTLFRPGQSATFVSE